MTIYDYISIMRAVRERFDVARFNLGGVNLWPVFRLMLFFAHEYKHLPAHAHLESRSPAPPTPASPGRLPDADRPTLVMEDIGDARLWLPPDAPHRPEILVLQAHTDYTARHEGQRFDPLLTGVEAMYGREVKIAALCNWHPNACGPARPRQGIFHQPLWRAFRAPPAEIAVWMRTAAVWCDFCNGLLGEPAITPPDLLAWTQRMMGLVPAFTAAFRRIDPGIILLQSFFDIDKLGAVIAARRLGIPIVDHQHGICSVRDSEMYVSWIDVEAGIVDPTPHFFWLWGDYFYRSMPEATASADKMVSGDLRWQPPRESRPLSLPEAGLRILYLHQGLISEDEPEDMSLLPGAVMDAIRKSPPSWQWLIRLHPRFPQTSEPVKRLLRERGMGQVIVDEPSRAALQSCLDVSDVAVTAYSTAVVEANDAGVPVVLHDPLGRIIYREAVEQGAMAYAETGPELVRAIADARHLARHIRFAEHSPELAREALARTLERGKRIRLERGAPVW